MAMTRKKFRELHERNFSGYPGGHVAYFSAARYMVGPLISLAEAARDQQDLTDFEFRQQINAALIKVRDAAISEGKQV